MCELLAEALQIKPLATQVAAAKFGVPCRVRQGMPLPWRIIAGGDSCGRTLAVGSIAGLLFGVSEELIEKTVIIKQNRQMLEV